MTDNGFETYVAALIGADTPRVWSLLITVFGDLAQTGDGAVSSGLLNAISAQVGLKPEATRVALHRLRKDGWIEGKRIGRRSSYTLTKWGLSKSAEASPLIYRTTAQKGSAWLCVHDPSGPVESSGTTSTWINGSTEIRLNPPSDPEICAARIGADHPLPDWVIAKTCPEPLMALAAMLHGVLTDLQADLPRIGSLSPLQVAVLRVLTVHAWRRIVLRVPDLPDDVFPRAWKGPACRQLVASVLKDLPRPSLATLHQHAALQEAA